jgi:RNA polymerase sigma factor (sigma-70 family)
VPQAFSISTRNALVAKNAGLVRAVVRSVGVEPSAAIYDDCVQEGMVGLCKAAERFDPTRGVAFSTFAWQRIAGCVKECLCRTGVVSEPVRRVSRRAAAHARGEAVEPHPGVLPFHGETSSAMALPECMIERDVEDELIGRLDAAAVPEAVGVIGELSDDERDVLRAALDGATISRYATERRRDRERVGAMLRQATQTITDWASETGAATVCPLRLPARAVARPRPVCGWVQLVFGFMLWRAPRQTMRA